MTNKELFYNFQKIEYENDNIFDKYCALAKLEKEYQTTEFSQAFGNITIIEAYNLYIKDSTSIGSLLREFKNVDLPNMLGTITDKLSVQPLLENLDGSTADLLKMILEQGNI